MPVARDGPAGVEDTGGPKEWFEALPILTKYWFGATAVCTLAGNLGMFHPGKLLWNWEAIIHGFELWRIVTCFCYAGAFYFRTLMLIVTQVMFSQRFESAGPFNTGAGGGTADYAFMLLFGALFMLLTKPLANMYWPIGSYYQENLTMFVVYVWSKKFPNVNMSFWGVPIQGFWMPWVYWAFAVFTAAPWRSMVHGYMCGHIFYFLVDVVPNAYGKDILFTPQFLIDQFGIGHYVGAATPRAPDNRPNAVHRPHQWGTGGQSLGGSGPTGRAASAARSTGTTSGSSSRGAAAPPAPRQGGGYTWGGGGQKLGS